MSAALPHEIAMICTRLAVVDLRSGAIANRVELGEDEEIGPEIGETYFRSFDPNGRKVAWRRVRDGEVAFSEEIAKDIAPALPYFQEFLGRVGPLGDDFLVPTTDGHVYRFDLESRTHTRLAPDVGGGPRRVLSFHAGELEHSSADSSLRPYVLRPAVACRKPHTPPEPFPIVVLHHKSLEKDAPALLSRLGEDGSVAWTVELPEPPDYYRGTFKRDPPDIPWGGSDLQRLDLDTGELVWELRAPRDAQEFRKRQATSRSAMGRVGPA